MSDRSQQRVASVTGPPSEPTPVPSLQGRWGLLAFAYAVLVVYGSLYPFAGWRPTAAPFSFLLTTARERWGRADMLINVLAYLPLGFLLARAWGRRTPVAVAAVFATLAGGALSFAMESIQQYLPSRVASVSDIVTNTLGALIGAALIGFVHEEGSLGAAFSTWRSHRLREGRLADLGLMAIGLWGLSQLAPFVPTDDIGELRHSLAPLWATLRDPAHFDLAQWGVYAANITGLALLARTLGRPERSAMQLFFGFVTCVLILKAPIETRQLSLEAIAGALAAGLVAPLMIGMRLKTLARAGALFIIGGFALAETVRGTTLTMYPFSWVPFTAQMEHPLIGMLSILDNLWPAAALAYLIRFASPVERRPAVAWIGGITLAATVFALEWHKQRIPGRVGDITTVLVIVGTWIAFWWVPLPAVVPTTRTGTPIPQRAGGRYTWIVAGALLLGAAALSIVVLFPDHDLQQVSFHERKLANPQAPQGLSQARFVQFRPNAPHLPNPRLSALAKPPSESLEALKQATGDADNLLSAPLQALVDPHHVFCPLLEQHSPAPKVNCHGSTQVEPLVIAYDRLFGLRSATLRAALQMPVESGDYGSDELHSPYYAPDERLIYCRQVVVQSAITAADFTNRLDVLTHNKAGMIVDGGNQQSIDSRWTVDALPFAPSEWGVMSEIYNIALSTPHYV